MRKLVVLSLVWAGSMLAACGEEQQVGRGDISQQLYSEPSSVEQLPETMRKYQPGEDVPSFIMPQAPEVLEVENPGEDNPETEPPFNPTLGGCCYVSCWDSGPGHYGPFSQVSRGQCATFGANLCQGSGYRFKASRWDRCG
jgi:hypothetical protein